MCRARHLQCRDMSSAKAGQTQSLRRCELPASIREEPRGRQGNQFFARCAKVCVHVRSCEIQYAKQRTFECQDQIGIAWSAAQPPLLVYKEGIDFTQCRQLAVCGIKNRKCAGWVVASSTVEGTNGRQRRYAPSVGNDPESKADIWNNRHLFQYRNQLFEGMQWRAFRRSAGRSWRRETLRAEPGLPTG